MRSKSDSSLGRVSVSGHEMGAFPGITLHGCKLFLFHHGKPVWSNTLGFRVRWDLQALEAWVINLKLMTERCRERESTLGGGSVAYGLKSIGREKIVFRQSPWWAIQEEKTRPFVLAMVMAGEGATELLIIIC